MGYASYLEDINRRLEDGLARALSRRRDNRPGPIDKKLILSLESLIKTAKRDIVRIKNLQDVATDASLDMAQELISLRSENARLDNLIRTFNSSSGNIAEKYLELVAENEKLRSIVDQDLVEEYCRIDDELKKLTIEWMARKDEFHSNEGRLIEKIEDLNSQLRQKEEVLIQLNDKITSGENRSDILEKELANQRTNSLTQVAELKQNINVLKSNIVKLQARSDELELELKMIKNPQDTYNLY